MITGILIGVFLMLTLICVKLAMNNASLARRLQSCESTLETHVGGVDKRLTEQSDKLAQQNDWATKQIKALIRRTDPKALTEEQEEFKKNLEVRWKSFVETFQADLEDQLLKDSGKLKKDVEKWKTDFMLKLNEEYKKAVDSIDFHKVEYKRTITKKRKEVSRKTKATNPQKQHRSIDDE